MTRPETYEQFKKRMKDFVLRPDQVMQWTEAQYKDAWDNHYDSYAARSASGGDEVRIDTRKRTATDPPENEPPSKKTSMDKVLAELKKLPVGAGVIGDIRLHNLLYQNGLTEQDYADYLNANSAEESRLDLERQEKEKAKLDALNKQIQQQNEDEKKYRLLHPNLDSDPLHGKYYTIIRGGKADGTDLWQCTEEKIEDVYQHCYVDWWTPAQRKILQERWKKEHPLTYEELYQKLNANEGYWREINKVVYRLPRRYDKTDLDSIKYYEVDVPFAGALLDWYRSPHFKQWGPKAKEDVEKQFAEIKGTNVQAWIDLANFKQGAKDASKWWAEFFDSSGFKVFVFAVLGVAALGSGAALVHEVRK